MGDMADMALDGTLCMCCGQPLADEYTEPSGYPEKCDWCEEQGNKK